MENRWYNWPNTDALALVPRRNKITLRAIWFLVALLAIMLGGMMAGL